MRLSSYKERRKIRRSGLSSALATAIVIVVILAALLGGLVIMNGALTTTKSNINGGSAAHGGVSTYSGSSTSSRSSSSVTVRSTIISYSSSSNTPSATSTNSITTSLTSSSTSNRPLQSTSTTTTKTTSTSAVQSISTTESSSSSSFSSSSSASSTTTSTTTNSTGTLPQSALNINLLGPSAYDPQSRIIYFAGINSIIGIDGSTNTLISTTNTGQNISSMTFDTSNGLLYYVTQSNNTLYQFNPQSGSYDPTGFNATSILYDSVGNELFAGQPVPISFAYPLNETFFVINPSNGSVVANFSVPLGAFGYVNQMAYDPIHDYIFAMVSGGSADGEPLYFSYVVNAATLQVIASLPSGSVSFTYDAMNGYTFVANDGYLYKNCIPYCADSAALIAGNNVSVYNGTKEINALTVNPSPNSTIGSVSFDPANGNLYVINSSVSIARDSQGAPTNIMFSNYTLCAINASNGSLTRLANLAISSYPNYETPTFIMVDPADQNSLYIATSGALYFVNIGNSSSTTSSSS